MKNRKSFSFSILLLLVNTTGAVGALLSILKVDFGTVLQPPLFFGGMFLICLFCALFWSGEERRKTVIRGCLLALVCLVFLLLFRRSLADGMGLALQGLLDKMNERYGVHLVWNFSRGAEQSTEGLAVQATCGVLAAMLPYVLLTGYGVFRKRVTALLAADAVWFCAACVMDEFPAYVWLVPCILGMAAVIIQNAYRDDERAGVQAVLIGTAALGIVMALAYRFALPVLDGRYEELQEARVALSIKINEEWIPELRRMLVRLGSGIGPGTNVSGKLTRKTGTVYTADEIYRVTFTSAPESSVYLRGFVGKDYEGDEWAADRDEALETYYRRKGWELPEREELVNLAYNAFRGEASGQVSVEELAAPGKFTVYPYGAEITAGYRIHWDGTVERKRGSYVLSYSAPENCQSRRQAEGSAGKRAAGAKGFGTESAGTEARYREYVYDTFCDYPEERFPELTEFLKEAGFRKDSVYHSLADVLVFLRGNAVYDLGVSNTPEGEDFVEYFLFERRRGYCAHFASAAVLMLRYLGIPARYVTGYAAAPESFVRNADGTCSTVILDRQAHAWAEIYLDGVGWMPVEMTPGAAPFPRDNTGAQLALAGQLTQADDWAAEGGESDHEIWQPVNGQGLPSSSPRPEEAETGSGEGEGTNPGRNETKPGDGDQSGEKHPFRDGADRGADGEPGGSEGSGGSSGGAGGGPGGPEGSGGSSGGVDREPGGPEGSGGSLGGADGEPGGPEGGNGSSGGVDGEPGQAGSGGSSGGADGEPGGPEGGNGSSGGAAGKPGRPEGSGASPEGAGRWQLPYGAGVALIVLSAAAGLPLMLLFLWKLIRRNARVKLERAENREKVFLLHRHIRRLLRTAGRGERPADAGEASAEFFRLLEQCGFGRKAPTDAELAQAEEYCVRMAEEAWAELPFYKKPLFLLADLYGLHGRGQGGRRGQRNRRKTE